MIKPTLLMFIGAALVGTIGTDAFADPATTSASQTGGRRQNDLAQQVAVRHRRLLVKNRFEVTPLFESSIDADYQHTVGGGLKLEYHLGDMFSIGVIGVGSTSLHTGVVDKVLATLPDTPSDKSKDPSKTQFLDHLNSIPLHGAAYVSITPWYGKLAAFSSAFVAFDFYFQAGVSFAQLKSDCPTSVCSDTHPGTSIMSGMDSIPADNDPKNDPPLNDGNRVGLYLGGGIHVFLSDFLALDLTVRDYAFSDNPSGADYNADQFVGTSPTLGDDNRFLHHLFFGAGLSIMLPTTVKRTP
ncbi:MAG: outer membrane beta-barrel domain-containing protein [Deltaproteobacteria bacterium]